MTTITIWHNPRCSKSRQALALLEAAGVTPKVVKYLETPPTESELKTTLKKLQCTPMQLVRRGEAVFKTLGLSKDHSDQEWITAMVSNPILIESMLRPAQPVRTPENGRLNDPGGATLKTYCLGLIKDRSLTIAGRAILSSLCLQTQ